MHSNKSSLANKKSNFFALAVEELKSFLLSFTCGRLQEKVAHYCTSFGLKNGVCHCVKEQWLEIVAIKFYAFFVLI